MAGHGRAWQGMAGHGRAWQGMAGHGRAEGKSWACHFDLSLSAQSPEVVPWLRSITACKGGETGKGCQEGIVTGALWFGLTLSGERP